MIYFYHCFIYFSGNFLFSPIKTGTLPAINSRPLSKPIVRNPLDFRPQLPTQASPPPSHPTINQTSDTHTVRKTISPTLIEQVLNKYSNNYPSIHLSTQPFIYSFTITCLVLSDSPFLYLLFCFVVQSFLGGEVDDDTEYYNIPVDDSLVNSSLSSSLTSLFVSKEIQSTKGGREVS